MLYDCKLLNLFRRFSCSLQNRCNFEVSTFMMETRSCFTKWNFQCSILCKGFMMFLRVEGKLNLTRIKAEIRVDLRPTFMSSSSPFCIVFDIMKFENKTRNDNKSCLHKRRVCLAKFLVKCSPSTQETEMFAERLEWIIIWKWLKFKLFAVANKRSGTPTKACWFWKDKKFALFLTSRCVLSRMNPVSVV